MQTALIILAAGQGTRMNSDLPKVLHPLGAAPLVLHAMRSGAVLEPEKTVIVTGHGADKVEQAVAAYDAEAVCVRQAEQKGTGHAVAQAQDVLAGFGGDAIVLYGDTPFISSETLTRMQEARTGGADIVVLGFEAQDPGRYGRLIAQGDSLERIVEAKDASPEDLAVTLCNSGVVMAEAATLFRLTGGLGNDNASGEFYLTDIVGLGRAEGLTARVVRCDEAETLGINTRAELGAAEAAFQARARAEAMENGATLLDPATTYIAFDTVIGRDTVIGPNVVFGPGVTVESEAEIRAFSHLEGCHVSRGAQIGPFARLRPGAELAEDVRVGNFVEIKNAVLDPGSKVNHLSYVGDAHVGAAANVGAGTITCNYDGVMKHHTEIGARSFIGSNTLLVAPVRVGAEAMTGTGTVVTEDVPEGALAIARARQVNKPGLARRLMEMLKAQKAKRGKK
ncbi:MAG: bifunctional UDP-N-acetylglucosamine diphosphorylase/glucosamine-1-phosphate N-acetyltransferase GlmU [Paracoccaceae bacterium]